MLLFIYKKNKAVFDEGVEYRFRGRTGSFKRGRAILHSRSDSWRESRSL